MKFSRMALTVVSAMSIAGAAPLSWATLNSTVVMVPMLSIFALSLLGMIGLGWIRRRA